MNLKSYKENTINSKSSIKAPKNHESNTLPKSLPLIIFGETPRNSSQTEELIELGVTRIISIVDKESWIPEIPDTETLEIFTEKHLPPTIGDIYQCLGFIESSPGLVYIHCERGKSDSSLMIAAAKMRYENKSLEEACSEVTVLRKSMSFKEVDKNLLKEFEVHVDAVEKDISMEYTFSDFLPLDITSKYYKIYFE